MRTEVRTAEHHTHGEYIYIYASQFSLSRRHVTERLTVHHTPCKMFRVSEYSRVYILVKNGGLRSNYRFSLNHLCKG